MYITDQAAPRMTPPLEPVPLEPVPQQPVPQQPMPRQPMPQQPMPQYQTETVYRPAQPQMIWRQPVPREPEPMPETVYGPDGTPMTRWRKPGAPVETQPKGKKSFWRKLLGLDR